jgi:hypothetical protein
LFYFVTQIIRGGFAASAACEVADIPSFHTTGLWNSFGKCKSRYGDVFNIHYIIYKRTSAQKQNGVAQVAVYLQVTSQGTGVAKIHQSDICGNALIIDIYLYIN